MDLLPVVPNPRFGHPPSWKISNGHISGTGHPIDFLFDPRVSNDLISVMSYPIHYHELQSSFGRNIGENNPSGLRSN